MSLGSSVLQNELAQALSGLNSSDPAPLQASVEPEALGGEPDFSLATSLETEPSQPEADQSQGVNWDDPSNPYLERFKGLQGTVQQLTEAQRAQQEQLQQYQAYLQAQAMQQQEQQFRQQIAHLPYDQQQYQLQMRQQAIQLEAQKQQLANAWNAVNQGARDIHVQKMALDNRLGQDDIATLQGISDPNAMAIISKLLSEVRQMRQQPRGANQFESVVQPSAGAPKQGPTKDFDVAEAQLAQAFRQAGI